MGRSGTSRGTLGEFRDGSRNPRGGPGRLGDPQGGLGWVGLPLGRSGTSWGTLGKFRVGSGDLGEVRDGLGDP